MSRQYEYKQYFTNRAKQKGIFGMRELVAIDLPGGPDFVDALQQVWQDGDAVLPIDQRLTHDDRTRLANSMRAQWMIQPTGRVRLDNGVVVQPGDALVVATSGSTGEPKGAVLTHDAVAASAEASSHRLSITPTDHWLACLPLSHVGGLSVVTRALSAGTGLTVLARFEPEAVTAAALSGATHTSLVTAALLQIDPSIFRCVLLGGAATPGSRPANAVATYGLTETGSGVVYDGVPLDGVEVRINDDGEILIRCPMMLRGYRDGTTPIDAEGWLHTNDLGSWLPDGQLHVHGRRGDLIITGGENVWPEQLERTLAQHPGIRDIGVRGLADVTWGLVVAAWLVPTDSSHPPSLEELRSYVRDRLPAFMAPRIVFVVESLPRTSLGKLRRNELPDLR